MPKAHIQLRFSMTERVRAVTHGLRRLGFDVEQSVSTQPGPKDICVVWNRIAQGDAMARAFERSGNPVLVLENASFGNSFAGGAWLHCARNFHNTAGRFPIGGHTRWDALNIDLAPWRTEGERVILPQRGIGPSEVRMPREWPMAQKGRLRPHPGTRPCVPLREDLARAQTVVTWGSGAAILACMWGIRVEWSMPNWVGAHEPNDESRLAMLRRLAWCNWRMSEIESGEAFARLLPR